MWRRPEHARRAAGLTLIEMVVTIVVIGIALVGTLQALRVTVASSADPVLVHQATALAEAHLEEILLKPFKDPDAPSGPTCPGPEGARPLYDNVCDYDGLDDAGPLDQTGTPVAGLGAYRVRVAVDDATSLGGLAGPDALLRVDVRVTHPSNVDVTVSGYRTAY